MFKNRMISYCLFSITVISGCGHSSAFKKIKDHTAVFALQPLGDYDADRLTEISTFIHDKFHNPVKVLQAISIPDKFLNTQKGERYQAESIIKWLKDNKNDSVAITIGITHKDIFITKYDNNGNIKQPAPTYAVWGIFGLGYQPGSSCVISDKRLYSANTALFSNRLQTVITHEIGHNMGLPHCTTTGCVMSDANEKISTIDNAGKDFCTNCVKSLE